MFARTGQKLAKRNPVSVKRDHLHRPLADTLTEQRIRFTCGAQRGGMWKPIADPRRPSPRHVQLDTGRPDPSGTPSGVAVADWVSPGPPCRWGQDTESELDGWHWNLQVGVDGGWAGCA